jgi:hypothetical protein
MPGRTKEANMTQTEFAMRGAAVLRAEGYTKQKALKGAWGILKVLEEKFGYNTLMLGLLKCCPICMRSEWLVETKNQRRCLNCGKTSPIIKLDELESGTLYCEIESESKRY